jgi:hypothetical protein
MVKPIASIAGRIERTDRSDRAVTAATSAAGARTAVAAAPPAAARTGASPSPAGAALVGGVDFACYRSPRPALDASLDEWLGGGSCGLDAPSWTVRATTPAAAADVVLIRARARGDAARLTVLIDGEALPTIDLGPRYSEVRLSRAPLPMVKPIRIELRRDGAPIDLDHLLLLRDVTPERL